MFAERDAARQRQKRFPAAWWHRALTAAAGALGSAAPRSPEALLVSVHTNSKALASTIFGNLSRLADGTPIQLRTFDESFPLLPAAAAAARAPLLLRRTRDERLVSLLGGLARHTCRGGRIDAEREPHWVPPPRDRSA